MKLGILDGRKEAARVLRGLIKQLRSNRQRPTLATIIVGNRTDSELYVRKKEVAAKHVGIKTISVRLPASSSQQRVIQSIKRLNKDPRITSILLQLPLPSHLETKNIIQAIDRVKDVDGLRPDSPVEPPFLLSMLHLAKLGKPTKGLAVILSASSPLQKRLEKLIQSLGHKVKSFPGQKNIPSATKSANLIFTFRGNGPRLHAKDVSNRAVIIDGGIRIREGKTVGDVEASAREKAKAYSPVPGGVGPLTIAYLLKNALELDKHASSK